ncbi:putative ribonuclease H protein [Glycine max]|nr:putative ribonuclease H protein [Glycine max]
MFDSKIDLVVSFLKDVDCKSIQPQYEDQWVWSADQRGQYTARSAYIVMRGDISEETEGGAFQELWKLKIPNKISAFVWRLLKDRLPTRVNLRRRQVEVEDSTCPFCRNMEESARHLFFQCSGILPVWWESLSWTNTVGAFPQNPKQHFLYHIGGMKGGARANR